MTFSNVSSKPTSSAGSTLAREPQAPSSGASGAAGDRRAKADTFSMRDPASTRSGSLDGVGSRLSTSLVEKRAARAAYKSFATLLKAVDPSFKLGGPRPKDPITAIEGMAASLDKLIASKPEVVGQIQSSPTLMAAVDRGLLAINVLRNSSLHLYGRLEPAYNVLAMLACKPIVPGLGGGE